MSSQNLSRRALVIGTAVLAPATAFPAASAAPAGGEWNAEAALDRYRQAIDVLRTRVVCAGWQLDEIGAARTLRYFQGLVDGREDDEENDAAIDFLVAHGQSPDWIFGGRLFGMICAGARHSPQASRRADPIFEVIEEHQRLYAAQLLIIGHHSRLEEELPRDRRRSAVSSVESKIVDTDDPRWIAAERAVAGGWDEVLNFAVELTDVRPTTLAGIIALLRYVDEEEASRDGAGFPDILHDDDDAKVNKERGAGFAYFIHRNVAAALDAMQENLFS